MHLGAEEVKLFPVEVGECCAAREAVVEIIEVALYFEGWS